MSLTEPITIRTARETVSGIDSLAVAMDRSRNWIVNQAIESYLATNAWQVEKIREGLAAARDGRVRDADEVLGDIAAKHGWKR